MSLFPALFPFKKKKGIETTGVLQDMFHSQLTGNVNVNVFGNRFQIKQVAQKQIFML